MQQRIRRTTTADATELAFASIGSGRTIVYVGGWLSHLELSWELPEERAFYEDLAAGRTLIRYDREGCGLSAPSAGPPTLARELEQLAAIIATLGEEPFDLMGTSLGAPVAAAWAAQHPDTVRRLVLYGGWARGAEIAEPSVRDHILGLIESHWGLGSDVLTDIFAPDADSTSRAELARYQRASARPEVARALLALSYQLDVSDLLLQITTPTLVVHRADDRAAPIAQAEALAAGIPGAQLTVLPGRSHLPWAGDSHELVTTIRRFLGLRAARRGSRTLTTRQREVAALISDGATNKEIAARLGIDERSAEGHVERIRDRLGFRSRAQIASWYAAQRDKPARAK